MTQDRPKTAPRRSWRTSFFVIVFAFDFGPLLVPFWLASPLGAQNDPKIDPKIVLPQDAFQDRFKTGPRPPKTLSGRPPDPPGHRQDPPRRPKSLPGPSWSVQKVENFEIVKKKSKKNVDYLALRFSLAMVIRNGRRSFATVEPQRVAAVVARSALQSAAPSAARRV